MPRRADGTRTNHGQASLTGMNADASLDAADLRQGREVVVTVRMRGSRILAGLALVVTATMVSSATIGAGSTVVGAQLSLMRRAASAAVLPITKPATRLGTTKRTISDTHALRAVSSAPQVTAAAISTRVVAAGILGSLVVGAGLSGWMLDFARKSSRTRGQPRMGVPVA
jgi:hypothetical protein